MSAPESLEMWVVYDHPRDLPNDFVARLWRANAAGFHPTATILTSQSLELLRRDLLARGLVCLSRMDGDDAKIIETWL